MPSKGTKLKAGNRVTIVNRKFCNLLRNSSVVSSLTDREITDICNNANKEIAQCILNNPLGFSLPMGLGNIAVTKYIPKSGKLINNFNEARKLSKAVPYLNLHTYGYMFRIKLFKPIMSHTSSKLYYYTYNADRKLKRSLAALLKETGGEQYESLRSNTFAKRFKLYEISY